MEVQLEGTLLTYILHEIEGISFLKPYMRKMLVIIILIYAIDVIQPAKKPRLNLLKI